MQVHKFNDLEALRVAVEIERTGMQFYRSVMGVTKNPQALELLKKLAEQEASHMAAFEKLYRQEASRDDDDGERAAFDEETNAYLSAIAAEVVFPGGAMARAMKRSLETITDVLLAGINSEKDSILFYSGMMSHTDNLGQKEIYQNIINEEWRHLYDLQEMLENLPETGL